jgi:hypothetical protein
MNHVTSLLTTTIDHFIETASQQQIDWEKKPSPQKWSAKEIIGHLCDSAQINLQRFVRCTYEENFKLIYEQDQWVAAQHYQQMDTNDLLQLWRLLNLKIALVLDHYPPGRSQAKCDNDKNGVSLHSVEWLAQDYFDHLQHHLRQIRNIQDAIWEGGLVPKSQLAGYSGTPLAKKLGIKNGFHLKLIGAPGYYKELFTDLPADLYFENNQDIKADFVHFFTKSNDEYRSLLPGLKEQIKPGGMIWVSWPKKASKVQTDISENNIRDFALQTGLVDVKVCAIDDTWSALKLVIPVKSRN